MKTKSKKRSNTPSSLLRIGGMDMQIAQLQDYPATSDPDGPHFSILNLVSATLADANDQTIFTGQVIVRINTSLPQVALAIITRLLQPFKGYFVINVMGVYTNNTSYFEVDADSVVDTNIQPTNSRSKRVYIAPLQFAARQ